MLHFMGFCAGLIPIFTADLEFLILGGAYIPLFKTNAVMQSRTYDTNRHTCAARIRSAYDLKSV